MPLRTPPAIRALLRPARRAALPSLSWSATFNPLKKQANASARLRAPKAAGGATLFSASSSAKSARGARVRARGTARAWPFAALLPALPALLLAAALLPACTTQPATPEEAVQQRAQARWDALIARDFESAWTYLTPAERESVKQQDYKQRFGSGGVWKEAQVQRVKCISGRCAAFIRLVTQNMAPGFAHAYPLLTNHFDEEWIREDGQWWYRGLASAVILKQGEERVSSFDKNRKLPKGGFPSTASAAASAASAAAKSAAASRPASAAPAPASAAAKEAAPAASAATPKAAASAALATASAAASQP